MWVMRRADYAGFTGLGKAKTPERRHWAEFTELTGIRRMWATASMRRLTSSVFSNPILYILLILSLRGQRETPSQITHFVTDPGQRLGIVTFLQRFMKTNRFGRDDMHQRSALNTGEQHRIDFFAELLLTHHNPAARSA